MLIFRFGYVPLSWRGGRYVILFKNKGDPSICDSYRGLLVSDHAGKILTSLLQRQLEVPYVAQVGDCQYGAVRGRGTALAQMAVRAFLDFCCLLALSCPVLFVDLTKAFDYALREIVMGWSSAMSIASHDRRNFLKGRGIPDEFLDDLLVWLDSHSLLLKEMGVMPNVIATVNSLHTSTFFKVPGNSSLLVTAAGGRQGCKLGALVFNLVYSVALRTLRRKLESAGIILRVSVQRSASSFLKPSHPGVSFSTSSAGGVPIV